MQGVHELAASEAEGEGRGVGGKEENDGEYRKDGSGESGDGLDVGVKGITGGVWGLSRYLSRVSTPQQGF